MFDWIASQISKVILIFPESPLQKMTLFFDNVNLLGHLNWVIPFDNMTDITAIWLTCIFAWKLWGSFYNKITSMM